MYIVGKFCRRDPSSPHYAGWLQTLNSRASPSSAYGVDGSMVHLMPGLEKQIFSCREEGTFKCRSKISLNLPVSHGCAQLESQYSGGRDILKFFVGGVSLYCFGACTGTHSVDQAGSNS